MRPPEIDARQRIVYRYIRSVDDCGGATLVLGANGQLGRALREYLPNAEFARRADFDVANPRVETSRDWSGYRTIINATAYTKVDDAETSEGRRDAWATNVEGVARLARIARENDIALVHVSTDYVFDGTTAPHREDEPLSPLGVYGQSKAAGDAVVGTLDRHFIIRTSWVIGDGPNFVRTMATLAKHGICPQVVDDQLGRLTFTSTLSAGILHLLQTGARYGTYNLTNEGGVLSWAAIARNVFRLLGRDPEDIVGVTTDAYFSGRAAAPRPLRSELDLSRIRAAGFIPTNQLAELARYLSTDEHTLSQ